ncbi:transcriptional regulator [Pseudomonas sp. FFUP_PS_473]|jgi:DNA-binding FrmR family transcriptional regulator|uniref:metal-sensing transcriptional repressor n=1 Tax=Pseudomonas TaxID=286 RepID=UPI000811309F|nr:MULTISPECIES: metal-sensing transcriptional repressor [Pseudomonas]MBP9961480.1 metal-sensing transcriptional repressor [Pseudomonas sp.]MEE3632806.1 metal-sensing transcriptional repressor [Pseudomonas sp. AL 58]ATR81842.1 transcriptional regulator [Pseudomonas sp. HLS-6]PLP95484.1 transcriptional regulator [Pseudomonas sp. FFUP_PS_473]WJM98304.1 metal-sensing transcriptional repressor [Pseudomonas defluvii]
MIKQQESKSRDAILKRLARVEGQVRGIQAMITRGDECEAVAQQFSAARKALDKAYQEMLVCLVEDAILSPEQSNQEKLAQVRAIFTKYT